MGKREKLCLNQVTLVAVSSVHMYETVRALKYSMRKSYMGMCSCSRIRSPFTCRRIYGLKESGGWRMWICTAALWCMSCTNILRAISRLSSITTGSWLNPFLWRDEFLAYDYIGAPWRLPLPEESRYRDRDGNVCRVGNGVSLRSKALMRLPDEQGWEWKRIASGTYNEDCFLCCDNKHRIEAAGLKIAPIEVAKYFSHEQMIPEIEGIEPFLFHQWRGKNKKYPRFRNYPELIRRKYGLQGKGKAFFG